MSTGSQQLSLLLWKDTLLRKRKPITIGGVVWAAVALLSLVVVRKNVDPEPKPTCVFAARALPSAGVGPFLQSFLCTLSNDCNPLDRYQEKPDYKDTRLQQYMQQFIPVFEDNGIQRVLHALPGAGRLLATITRSMDVPELHQIVKRGLKVSDLFKNTEDVINILSKDLKISNNISKTFINSALNFENILRALTSETRLTCSVDSISNFFNSTNKDHVKLFIQELCRMSPKDTEHLILDLVHEINIKKYINMVGKVIENLSGSPSIINLSNMMDALLRLSSIENYVPKEIQLHKWLPVVTNEIKEIRFKGFSYVNIDLIYRLLDLFEPVFKDTNAFHSISTSIDVLSASFKTLRSLLEKQLSNEGPMDLSFSSVIQHFFETGEFQNRTSLKKKIQKLAQNVEVFSTSVKSVLKDGVSTEEVNYLNGLTKVSQVIMDNLPKDMWRKVSYTLTLLNRFVLGCYDSARVHLHVESIMYETLKRNPKGVQIISKLGPDIVQRLLDGLSDAGRIQAIRGKVFHSGQLFCDVNRLQTLLKINKKEATDVKGKICNAQFKTFASDVIRSFGVNNASKTINAMASLVVSETLRGDSESEFIKVGELLENVKDLISYVKNEILNPSNVSHDWDTLFKNVSNYKEIRNVFTSDKTSPNLVLVTVHTALAHEVISENMLLDTYMTPVIAKVGRVLKAFALELDTVPQALMTTVRNMWPMMYEVVLKTLKDKDMGLLIIYDRDVLFCNLFNRENSSNIYSAEEMKTLQALCDVGKALVKKLDSDPENDKLIQAVATLLSNTTKDEKTVDWVQMIKDMQHLYLKVNSLFGFLFDDDRKKSLEKLSQLETEVMKSDLFSTPSGTLQLSVSVFSRVLDVLDSKIIGLNENLVWITVKSKFYYFSKISRELNIFTETLAAFINRDSNYTIKELPFISEHLRDLAINFAPLIRDIASFIAAKQIDIDPILDALKTSPRWPCGESGLGPALQLSSPALQAIKGAEILMCSGKEVMDEWNKADFFSWIDGMKSNESLPVPQSEKTFYSTANNFNKFVDNLISLGDAIDNVEMDQYNLIGAFEDAVKIISVENNLTVARRFFKNLDLIVNVTNEGDAENSSESPNRMWESYVICSSESKNTTGVDCKPLAWKAVRFTAKYIAEAGSQMVRDLTEYFQEISDPHADFLQLMGFTKRTGLHLLYENLPDFIDILFKSFLDVNFMKQITRAAGRKFWDCERIVDSLVLPTNGYITQHHIKLIKPYICPSLVHWVSVPTDENVLFDIFAKSQDLYFNKPAVGFDSKFQDFYDKILNLDNLMKSENVSKNHDFLSSDRWIEKFQNIGKTLIIHETNGTVTRKDIMSSNYMIDSLNNLYLTRISFVINNMFGQLKTFNSTFQSSQNKSEVKDYETFLKILHRKPEEAIRIFVFAISENLKVIDDYEMFDIRNSFDSFCQVSESWTSETMWMKGNVRLMKQFCKCDYRKYISLLLTNTSESDFLPNVLIKDFVLMINNLTDIYNNGVRSDKLDWKDTFKMFLKLDSDKAGEQIRNSVNYARELGLESMITYEHNKITYWNLCLYLLNGDDWWSALKRVNKETVLMDVLEQSTVIVEDLISNLGKIKIIRLLKDIRFNNTELLCNANISDYIPDKTNLISKLKDYMCQINETALYVRIPPLRLAAQIYDDDFKIKEKLNETQILDDIQNMEENLYTLLKNGPQKPQLPFWLTEEDVNNYYSLDTRLNQGPSRVEISFLILNNIIDAATLFVNSTYSTTSSAMTPWMKQVNLQLIKSSEYSALICDLPNLSMNEIYNDLIENFHWDLALSEIISGRNYTWFELNKSLNQLSDIAKHYTHDSVMGKMDRVMECLLNTTDDHPISKASMYMTLGSRVMRLIRAMLPHLKDVEGFANNSDVQKLKESLITAMPVPVPIYKLIKNETRLRRTITKGVGKACDEFFDVLLRSDVNINKDIKEAEEILHPKALDIIDSLNVTLNASQKQFILKSISDNYNVDYISKNLNTLRVTEFWSFKWISSIASGIEGILWHSGQMLRSLGDLEWKDIRKGEPNSILDLFIYLMKEQFVDNIVFRINNIIQELHPLFKDLDIEKDLQAISGGLKSITVFRKEIVSAVPLKFEIFKLFQDWDELKTRIVNKTLLPQLIVDEVQFGTFNLAPLINPEYDVSHVEDYVCGPSLSRLLQFNSTQVTLTDISKQLCRMSNTQIKSLASELFKKLNFSYVSDVVVKTVMKQVMTSSDLTEEEGALIFSIIGEAASLMPTFQSTFSNISSIIRNEPLLKSFQNLDKVTDALANADFLADAGNMMCGKPFYARVNRFYKAISELADNNEGPDQEQLDSLPTDFCRDLHKEVLKMGGGKILWSYAKPLLMGKILFTPDTPQVREIMIHANTSFAQVGQLTSLLHELADAFISLEEIMDHRSSLDDIYIISKSPFIKEGLSKLNGDNLENDTVSQLPDINLNNVLSQFGDVKKMKVLVRKLSQLTDCISLDRYIPVENEEVMETKASQLMRVNEFLAGIVFINANTSMMEKKSNSGVEYKIRMDIDNVPSTSRIKNQFWTPGPDSDFIDNLRYFRGFVQLQDIIDKAIIQTRSRHSVIKRDVSITNSSNNILEDWSVYTQQMPYPCWVKDDFQTTMYESQALIVAFFFCLILTVSSVVRFIVWERESGNTALMCVMGMKRRWHSLSWLLSSFVEVMLTMLVLCAILKWGGILPNTNTLLLLVLLVNFGFSIVMFCYMISSTFHSASLGAVSAAILYLLSFMPYIIIIAMEAELNLSEKLLASLFMSSGFSYGLLQTARYEVQGVGLQWSNIWESPQANDSMSAALSCLMVLFDSLFYAFIGWVINTLRFQDNVNIGVIGNISKNEQQKCKIGVRIDKLCKKYHRGNTVALSDVSMDLYKGNITTLLGHNGAGKTTLINILTGIITPTSGEIIINEDNRENSNVSQENRNKLRNAIGLCPQFDVLLEVLSAREHLSYYAQLKIGQSAAQVANEVDDMLDALGLGPLSIEPVKRLSGGLRRRLCVGLAFIAHPHLVVLDEPSSGVDPVARRDIWTLILGLKAGRTILLTTHHLDEAEILSDNVFIMHKGKIQASGSPLDLKQKYGEGYKLTLTYPLSQPPFVTSASLSSLNEKIQENYTSGVDIIPKQFKNSHADTDQRIQQVLDVVTNIANNAKLTEVKKYQVEINVPFLDSNGMNNDLVTMTQTLEEKQSILNFGTVTADCGGLEEVFLSLCDMKTIEEQEKPNGFIKETSAIDDWESEATEKSNGGLGTLWHLQLMALLQKRFLHYIRNPRLLIAALFLPTVFVAVAMGFSLIRPPPDSLHPLSLQSNIYGEHSTQFASLPKNASDEMHIPLLDDVVANIINTSFVNRTLQLWIENDERCKCVDGWQTCSKESNDINKLLPHKQMVILPTMKDIVQWAVNTHDEYVEKRYGGWSGIYPINGSESTKMSNDFVVWYNNKGQHSLPAYINTLNNALLKYRSGNNDINITTYSHPLKLSPEQLSKATLLQHVADVGISVVLLIGFSLVPAVSAVFLVGERCSQQKRLQLLSAVHPVTYWMATLLWDIAIIIAAIILSVIVFKIFALPVYVSRHNLSAICFLLLLYGFSSSTLVHLLEKLFGEPSLANMVIFCCNVFVSVVGLTILLIIDVVTTSDLAQHVRHVLHDILLLWPGFSLGDGLVLVSRNSIQADVLSRFGLDTYLPPLSWDVLGPHCLVLTCTTVIFFLINIAIEMRMFDKIIYIFKSSAPPKQYEEEDCDVATERYRVELATLKAHYNMGYSTGSGKSASDIDEKGYGVWEVEQKWEKEGDVLQILGLGKEYQGMKGIRVAVQNMTFGVKKGQCFGMLGVNGAGKSTTFSMLTGELRPTRGHIYLNGKRVSQRGLCDGSIAYCPQNDALDSLLTLTEHLQFYSRIRGVQRTKQKITNIMEELGITRYKDQRAETLSGGNKRKLCLAIALVGDAPLLLLDEPTSGMDPNARKHAGRVLTRAAQRGRALLLSSHSLLECEALCSPTGLMWAGKLLALGAPTYLKQRFAGGHLVRLVGNGPDLWKTVQSTWSDVNLLSLHPSSIQVLLSARPLSSVFRGIANISTQTQLKDYSVNQSSLDQVFINFSNSREDDNSFKMNKGASGIRLTTLEREYSNPAVKNYKSSSEDTIQAHSDVEEDSNATYNTKF